MAQSRCSQSTGIAVHFVLSKITQFHLPRAVFTSCSCYLVPSTFQDSITVQSWPESRRETGQTRMIYSFYSLSLSAYVCQTLCQVLSLSQSTNK